MSWRIYLVKVFEAPRVRPSLSCDAPGRGREREGGWENGREMGVSLPGPRRSGPIRRKEERVHCRGTGEGIAGGSGRRRGEAFLHCSRGTHDVGLQLYWAGENEHGREGSSGDRSRQEGKRAGGRAGEGNGVVNLDPPSYPPRFHFSAFETYLEFSNKIGLFISATRPFLWR